ncbi:MAG TPA: hypothetical protein VHI93_06930 [Candidatus Thermoplasmatota archaeon]|nr:hypothetical protein [Candidatus Thermoplasmatota archaeon]
MAAGDAPQADPPAAAQAPHPPGLRGDRSRKLLLDGLIVLVLGLLVAVIVAAVGLLPLGIAQQAYLLAGATAILAGCAYLFNTVRWTDIRAEAGQRLVDRAKADVQLTVVSIAALITVVLMAVVELFALLYFLGLFTDIGEAGFGLAANFVLFQTIMLLVYLAALVTRENNPSRFEPKPGARLAAAVLTPLAGAVLLAGVLLAASIGVSAAGSGLSLRRFLRV